LLRRCNCIIRSHLELHSSSWWLNNKNNSVVTFDARKT
jgi:hypothetical protein